MGKALGKHDITADMLKYLCEEAKKALINIINEVFVTKPFPLDWTLEIIIPFYKKGYKRKCKNYRNWEVTEK